MTPANRQEFFRRLQSVIPEPETELSYRSPFELLVAVILSAQATDISVNKATARLYPVANTPQACGHSSAAVANASLRIARPAKTTTGAVAGTALWTNASMVASSGMGSDVATVKARAPSVSAT